MPKLSSLPRVAKYLAAAMLLIKGYKQNEIARTLGVSESTVTHWVKGGQDPALAFARRWCRTRYRHDEASRVTSPHWLISAKSELSSGQHHANALALRPDRASRRPPRGRRRRRWT